MRLIKGWGDNLEHVLDMIHLLVEILQAPEPSTLEMFLVGIPMIFKVVILSPHGYFGNFFYFRNVRQDTGGQVNKYFIIAISIPCYPVFFFIV